MPDTNIEDRLSDIGDTLRRQPSVRREVMRRVTETSLTSPPPARRRGGMLGRIAAIAACVTAGVVLWALLGGNGGGAGGLGPREAFAAAIANVERARTFSARGIVVSIDDGKRHVRETAIMFKEPDRERLENRRGMPIDGETTITDYGARRRLKLFPDDKLAELTDISTMYRVDDKTGELKPSELHTGHRDDVLRISAMAVKDVGTETLNGQAVRVLRSDDGREPIKTVWVNASTGKPMKIELSRPTSGESYTYDDIRIDEAIDDALFSLDVPKGYAVAGAKRGDTAPPQPTRHIDEMNGKMMAKMMHLLRTSHQYSFKHGGDFPEDLHDLAKAGTTTDRALRTALAAPGEPDGPPVIVYRKPRKGKDSGSEIVLYEVPEHRRDGKVVVGMWDGHAQIVNADRFEELMK